jgi:hypothetical protein
VVPTLAFGAGLHQFQVAAPTTTADNSVIVPLNITNQDNLAGMDIPLQFSEGVVLKEVQFEDTRVDYFDLKIANINNDEHTVVIGLLPQMTPEAKPELAAGSGTIANLVFDVVDESLNEISVKAITTENPNHSLTFVYHDDQNIRVEHPEFDDVSLSLANLSGATPNTFYLAQNYPNPFNPSTTIEFSLAAPSHVELTVFNVLGQEVTTLANGQYQAGVQSIVWDANEVSSGVYFYRLTTDNKVETRKMMLLK